MPNRIIPNMPLIVKHCRFMIMHASPMLRRRLRCASGGTRRPEQKSSSNVLKRWPRSVLPGGGKHGVRIDRSISLSALQLSGMTGDRKNSTASEV